MTESPDISILNWRTITKKKQNRFCVSFCMCAFLICLGLVLSFCFLFVCLDFCVLFFVSFSFSEEKGHEVSCLWRWGGSWKNWRKGKNMIKIYHIKMFS